MSAIAPTFVERISSEAYVSRGRAPTRHLCRSCLRPVIHVEVEGELVVADLWEWFPPGMCESCQRTRRAHPGKQVDCKRCNGLGVLGDPRPFGRVLGVWVDETGTTLVRILDPADDREPGEALHKLHVCVRAKCALSGTVKGSKSARTR